MKASVVSPSYIVAINDFGDAVVTMTLAFAETVQDQLRRHGHRCKLTTAGKVGMQTTLNFGRDADLVSIQQLIDSFSQPTARSESGRTSSDSRHAFGED